MKIFEIKRSGAFGLSGRYENSKNYCAKLYVFGIEILSRSREVLGENLRVGGGQK